MNTFSAAMVGIILTTSLVSCSTEPEPADENRQAASCSETVYLRTKSELKNWWSGESLPITWKSKVMRNSDFDGSTRPDHAPPQGFQGLVQTVESGTHTQPIEYSATCTIPPLEGAGGFGAGNRKTMELTPTINIDGKTIELATIPFANMDLGSPHPYQMFGTEQRYYSCGEEVVHYYSTPRGDLQYSVKMDCKYKDNSSVYTLVVSNFRR
jgi:hypothetical protein